MEFFSEARGENARDAFRHAVQEAQYENGHGGYTGTIAEKHNYKMIPCEMTEEAITKKVEECFENENHFVQNKWGPSGCIKVRDGFYIFFGWASS